MTFRYLCWCSCWAWRQPQSALFWASSDEQLVHENLAAIENKTKKIKQKQLVCYSIFNLHRPAQTVQMTHLHNYTSEWNRHITARPLAPIPPLVLQWDHREQLSSLTTVVVRAPEVSASYILEQAQHWHGCSHLSVISVHPQSLKLYWLNVKIYYLSFAVKAHPQHLSSASFPQHLLIS